MIARYSILVAASRC